MKSEDKLTSCYRPLFSYISRRLGGSSKLQSHVRMNFSKLLEVASSPEEANQIRHDLCLGRGQVDCERARYMTCCRNTEGSIADLKNFLDNNIDSGLISSLKKLELERLRSQFSADVHALLEQTHRTNAAESQIKDYEAQLSSLGIWVVGLPTYSRL